MQKIDHNKITAMRYGGKLLRDILLELRGMIRPGLEIMALELRFLEFCRQNNVTPACKGYRIEGLPAFPAGLCIGINSQSVHCYPKKGVKLIEGDLISVDTVIAYQGYHVDSAFTVGIGNISLEDRRFLETAQLAANSAYKQAKAGGHIGDIGYTMETVMNMAGFNVLEDYVGHGIGKFMHESPDIPCFGAKGRGPEIKLGQTLAIEALTCQGSSEVNYVTPHDWETEMADGKKFAIFEHTILIGENGPEILTA